MSAFSSAVCRVCQAFGTATRISGTNDDDDLVEQRVAARLGDGEVEGDVVSVVRPRGLVVAAIASASSTIRAAWSGRALVAASAAVRISIVRRTSHTSATLICAVEMAWSSEAAMTEPSSAPTRGLRPLPTSISSKRGERAEGLAHHRAADPELLGEIAFARQGVADPQSCARGCGRLTASIAVWTSDLPPIGAGVGHQAATPQVRKSDGTAEAPAEGAGEAGVVLIAVAIADQRRPAGRSRSAGAALRQAALGQRFGDRAAVKLAKAARQLAAVEAAGAGDLLERQFLVPMLVDQLARRGDRRVSPSDRATRLPTSIERARMRARQDFAQQFDALGQPVGRRRGLGSRQSRIASAIARIAAGR